MWWLPRPPPVRLAGPLELADRKRLVQDLAETGAPAWAEALVALMRSGDAEVADTALDQQIGRAHV